MSAEHRPSQKLMYSGPEKGVLRHKLGDKFSPKLRGKVWTGGIWWNHAQTAAGAATAGVMTAINPASALVAIPAAVAYGLWNEGIQVPVYRKWRDANRAKAGQKALERRFKIRGHWKNRHKSAHQSHDEHHEKHHDDHGGHDNVVPPHQTEHTLEPEHTVLFERKAA